MSEDAYPPVSTEDMRWLVTRLESLAKKPDDIQRVYRVREGLDLEIVFAVATESLPNFTDKICFGIENQFAERTGVLSPVIYVEGLPHSHARWALAHTI